MMRAVQLADLEYVTRALLAVPAAARVALLDDMLDTAARGYAYHRITGSAHPQHGVGTLMSVATRLPLAPRSAALDREYLRCLAMIARRIGRVSS